MPLKTDRIGPSPAIEVDHIGEGDFVLCLHGIGGNRRNWHDNLPALAKAGFHAAAWDARGYGGSDDYDGPLRLEDLRGDVLRLLDHFGVGRAHLIGLSMGGRIAADFCAAHPARVASAIFCDTHLGFAHMSDKARAKFIALRKDPLMAGQEPADIADTVAATLIGDPAHEATYAKLVDSMNRLHKVSYIKAIEATVSADLRALYDEVRCPAMVVVGALDRVTPPRLAREIALKLGDARLAVIPGAGHLSNIEQAERFNALAVDFLSSQRRMP